MSADCEIQPPPPPPWDGGTPDGGSDGGTPDGGGGTPDGGPGEPDGGPSGPPTPPAGPPCPSCTWPTDAVMNYSTTFNLGRVQSVGLDNAHNLWLLDGPRIGVLRPGDATPTWVSNLGQASRGFGRETLATGSTVICGGEANRAYVGYSTYELSPARRESPGDLEYLKGDMDAVKLTPEGSIVLEEHLGRTTSPSGLNNIGIRNTNDWHFDEDRSVLSCTRVARGPNKNDVFIGTNHGVTRIRGLVYNSHLHPVWWTSTGSQKAGYTYALGITQSGDVFIGNDWMLGLVTPTPLLQEWDRSDKTPFRIATHIGELSSLEDFDFWRGVAQTTDGLYYLASKDYGLWEMRAQPREGDPIRLDPVFQRVTTPTRSLTALAATDDGSLFIGTAGSGLLRMKPDKTIVPVPEVAGSQVKQLVYEPGLSPSMLVVVTNSGVFVLRGY